MRSAMRLRMAERSVEEMLAQASLAAWAASRASSTSSAEDLANSARCAPLMGAVVGEVLAFEGGDEFAADEVVVAGAHAIFTDGGDCLLEEYVLN
jgi:hypothetical protein